MTKEKRSMLTISTLMQLIFAFFEIFFSIYVYDISKNLNIIILYNISNLIVFLLLCIGTYKFINEKVLYILYKLSFVMSLISILLTFTISSDRIYMIFITQLFVKTTHFCYYMPHEVATMNSNKRNQIGKFIGLSSTLSLIAGFIGPLFSGFMIDYVSYFYIFIILSILSIICFILSFNIDIIKVDKPTYGIVKFLRDTHQVKFIRRAYVGHSFYKLSNDIIVKSFIPILIYLKTGTNFSVGVYSALASILAGIMISLYSYYWKNKSSAMWISTIVQIIVSFSILIWSSLIVFIIYYFVKMITSQLLQNGTNETVLSILHNTDFKFYAIENFVTYNFYNLAGNFIGCILCLVFYNLFNNVLALTILLALVSLTQIIATMCMLSSDKLKKEALDIINQEN